MQSTIARRFLYVAGKPRRYLRELKDLHRKTGSLSLTAKIGVAHLRIVSKRAVAIFSGRLRSTTLSHRVSEDVQIDPRPLLAVRLTGGIGDYIVVARFFRDLLAAAEPFRFDVFCKNPGTVEWIFSSLPGFNKAYSEFLFFPLISEYSLAIQANQLIVVHSEYAHWDKLASMRKLMRVCSNIIEARSDFDVCVQHHPYMDNHLANKAVFRGARRDNLLHKLAGIPYGGPAFSLPRDAEAPARLGLPARYITINNGFDADFAISGLRSTKCYPHCDELVAELKKRFPGVAIVQVGTTTSQDIAGVDISLVGRTSLGEVAAVLERAELHIDNEGGLVHLAACLGTRSVVLFGPTSLEYFSYPRNINVPPASCGNCWWIEKTWMSLCPRGDARPACLYDQLPNAVADVIERRWVAENDK